MIGLLTRPFRLIGLAVTVALVVGGWWAWRKLHESTPAEITRAVDDFRTMASVSPVPRGAPRPGVYVYAVKGQEKAEAGPLAVDRPLPGRAPMIVRATRAGWETELRLSEEHVEGWRFRLVPAGVRAVWSRTDLSFLGFGRDDRRDLAPAPLHLPADLSPGRTWRSAYRAGTLAVAVQSRVLRRETVTVGGRRVPCVVVQIRSDTRGAHSGRRTERLWWSKELGLPVRSESTTDISGIFGLDATATLTLQSTTPRT